MSKILSTVLLLVGFVTLAAFQNCSGQAPSPSSPASAAQLNQKVTVNGTVTQANLDGCSYLICAVDNSDGKTKCFIPRNIDPSLLNAGNVVQVDGTIRSDLMTTCMAGAVLDINKAQLISGSTKPVGP